MAVDKPESEGEDTECEEEEMPHGPKHTAEHFDDFWQSSSLQGLPRVFTETVRFWKLFWFVLFLLLVAGCIYQMWSIFENYYDYSTSTSVTIEYKHLPLPSITICNVNPVRHTSLVNHSEEWVRDEYARMMAHNESIWYETKPTYSNRYDQMFETLSFLDAVDTEKQLEMGHQINPMLQACMMFERPCDYSNFTQNLSSEFGSCYTLNSVDHENSSGPLKIVHAGLYYGGVDLVLFAEEKEYLRGFNYARGFRMAIHPYNTIAQVEQDPIAIGTGEETFIRLKMSNITRLEPPYGQCSQEYADSFQDLYGYRYNVDSCNATCREYKVASKCGCTFKKSSKYYTKEHQTLPSCHHKNLDCGSDVWFAGGNCTCPLPCSELKYTIQTSSNPWGSAQDFDNIVGELCRLEKNSSSPDSNCAWLKSAEVWQRQEMLRNNFAKVRIYFNELLYDVMEENPTYDWSQFMADFGGNIGLWIGASIFTILEFVELFSKICVSKLQRTNRCHGTRKTLFKDSRRGRKRKKSEPNGNQQEIPLKEKEAMA